MLSNIIHRIYYYILQIFLFELPSPGVHASLNVPISVGRILVRLGFPFAKGFLITGAWAQSLGDIDLILRLPNMVYNPDVEGWSEYCSSFVFQNCGVVLP